MEFVMNELDLFEKRDGDVFYITEETKEELRSIAPFWENNNLRSKGGALLPDEVSVDVYKRQMFEHIPKGIIPTVENTENIITPSASHNKITA